MGSVENPDNGQMSAQEAYAERYAADAALHVATLTWSAYDVRHLAADIAEGRIKPRSSKRPRAARSKK
jgi:hypothetical protein